LKKPSKNFWNNKKILVTGHTGFTGSWLSLVLNIYNSKIYGVSLKPTTSPSMFQLLNIKKKLKKNYFCDIRNLNKIQNIFKSVNPDVIFHLAAQPLIKEAIINPKKTLETNIIGISNILKASMNLAALKKIVIITSDKCYDNVNSKKIKFFKESDKLGGSDPYSASKACAEIIVNAYANTYFTKKVKISTARAGNLIGGGDWSNNRLLPDIYKSLEKKRLLNIRYPSASRPWQHVLDAINGYMLLAQSSQDGAWNFGPNSKKVYTVKDILNIICIKNPDLKWKYTKPLKKQESLNLNLNTKKANIKLKWKPKWNFKKALNETEKWYSNYQNKKNLYNFTLNQIKNFYN
jgi:CDP-glucose 4,6-dehydratase